MRRFLKLFIFSLFFACFLLWITGYGYIFYGLRATYLRFEKTAQIDDAKFFYNDTVFASEKPFEWKKSKSYNSYELSDSLNSLLENYKTSSFVVIKNDQIIFEKYWDKNLTKNNKSNSFSMAKSILSLVVGCAIDDGYISSLDMPVKDIFPDLSYYEKGKDVTIGNLLNMTAGLDWKESYFNPFGITARFYYTKNLNDLILDFNFNSEPGLNYVYQSGATQLASMMLDSILIKNGTSLSEYTSSRFWKKIGAKENALWSLDRFGGDEKGFCCFHSNALDFAKIGRLFLNNGFYKNNKVISNSYLEKIKNPVVSDFYSYGWWITKVNNHTVYYMRGFKGQYVVIVPDKNIIVVRLGRKEEKSNVGNNEPPASFKMFMKEVLTKY